MSNPSITDRFWAKVDKKGPLSKHRPELGPCWIWMGAKDPQGYGRFSVNRRARLAHKWIYECERGAVPGGLELDHLCRVPSCVRPSHLEPVTHAVNLGRSSTAMRTHCPQGHPYDAANTYHRARDHSRQCRQCIHARTRRTRRRKREERKKVETPA